MSKKAPKLLRNTKTGAVFPFNAHLAKRNRNMVPCDAPDAPSIFEEVDATGDLDDPNAGLKLAGDEGGDDTAGGADDGADQGGSDEPVMIGDVPIGEASKDQLEAYAKAAFGVDLDKRKSIDSLRQIVLDLIEKA